MFLVTNENMGLCLYINMRFVEEVEEADLNDAKRSDAKQYFFYFFKLFYKCMFF